MAGITRKFIPHRLTDTLFEGLLFLPVPLAISELMLRGAPLVWWLLSVLVVRALCTWVVLRVKRRVWLVGIGVLLSAVTPAFLSISAVQAVILTLVGALSFWRSVRIVTSEYAYPVTLYVLGLLTYGAYAVLAHHFPVYQSLAGVMSWLAVVCVVLVLIAVNRVNLGEASFTATERIDVDTKVRHMNHLHVAVLFTIVLILAAFSPVLGNLSRLFPVFHPSASRPPTSPKLPSSAAKPPLPKPAAQGPFSHILSVVFEVIAIFLICVIGAWFVWQAGKLIVSAVSRLMARLRGQIEGQSDEGYVDHVEALDTHTQKERLGLQRFRRSQSPIRWGDLEGGREKARFLYKEIISRAIESGFPFEPSDTPRQTMDKLGVFLSNESVRQELPDLLHMYERARYSQHDIDEQVVEAAHHQMGVAKLTPPSKSGKLFLLRRSGQSRR